MTEMIYPKRIRFFKKNFINCKCTYCIHCGYIILFKPKTFKSIKCDCGNWYDPQIVRRMKTCEKYIEVFNGGFLKVCILKIYKYILQKLPYFMYKKIKFLIGYIQFDHDSIYRNTRRNTDCDCKFLTISIKLFKKFKEFKFGEHWCDILLKEGYL